MLTPMLDPALPFATTSWGSVPSTVHDGTTGVATWRTVMMGSTRTRMAEYSAGYEADHWCSRGHVLLVLAGSLRTELDDGRVIELSAGQSYSVSTDMEAHRSSTETGARLFIVD